MSRARTTLKVLQRATKPNCSDNLHTKLPPMAIVSNSSTLFGKFDVIHCKQSDASGSAPLDVTQYISACHEAALMGDLQCVM